MRTSNKVGEIVFSKAYRWIGNSAKWISRTAREAEASAELTRAWIHEAELRWKMNGLLKTMGQILSRKAVRRGIKAYTSDKTLQRTVEHLQKLNRELDSTRQKIKILLKRHKWQGRLVNAYRKLSDRLLKEGEKELKKAQIELSRAVRIIRRRLRDKALNPEERKRLTQLLKADLKKAAAGFRKVYEHVSRGQTAQWGRSKSALLLKRMARLLYGWSKTLGGRK